MDKREPGPRERQARQAVRAFLLAATLAELQREKTVSEDLGDHFRAACVQELIDERGEQEDAGLDARS